MDYTEAIDDMWPIYDTDESGYLDKEETKEMIEGVCKYFPRLNHDYSQMKNQLRVEHGVPINLGE